MRTLAIRIAASLLMLLALGGPPAAAQEGVGVEEEPIANAALDIPAHGPRSLVFARLTLPPGGSGTIPAGDGPSAHFLVAGEWAVTGATPDGDRLLLPPRTGAEIRNSGKEPAVVLSVLVAASASGLEGASVTWTPLGEPVDVPAGEAQVTLLLMTLDTGAISTPHQLDGPEVVDVLDGSVVLVLNPGSARVLRATGDQEAIEGGYQDPNATPLPGESEEEEEEEHGTPEGVSLPGTWIGLDTGDAALVAPGGSRVIQAVGDTPASIMVVSVAPAGAVPATPVAPAATPVATPVATP